ncbi:MAG: ethanolamine ammonia-lyase subunit EutC [Symbiobacteriia bacterium]
MLTEKELRDIVAGVLAGLGYQFDGPTPAPDATDCLRSGGEPLLGVPSCNPAPQPGLAYRAPHPAVVMSDSGPAGAAVAAATAAAEADGLLGSGPWGNPEAMREMLATTPARIGIGRTGCRYDTRSWLKFRMDHAAARDAIFHEVAEDFPARLAAVPVRTQVADRRQYLIRPDLGRRLSPESEAVVRQQCAPRAQVQVLLVDGLSGVAVERNAADFLRALEDGLRQKGLRLGTPIYVTFGRVAVMDHIGDILQPDVVVELVGERPGLATAESMSAYFCYRPDLKTIESDRTLISNIHQGGIPPVEAGAHAAGLVARMLEARASGVKLALQSAR